MHYKEWVDLFGKDNDDKGVKNLLAKYGVKKVPAIAKDEIDAQVEFDELMLTFTSAELFPSRSDGGDGASVLSCVVLPISGQKWGEYKGPLPLDIDRADSQKKLRKRFGEPRETNVRFRWDEWEVDGLLLRATYTKDLAALESLSLELPQEG